LCNIASHPRTRQRGGWPAALCRTHDDAQRGVELHDVVSRGGGKGWGPRAKGDGDIMSCARVHNVVPPGWVEVGEVQHVVGHSLEVVDYELDVCCAGHDKEV
jgi:hypothetical protein